LVYQENALTNVLKKGVSIQDIKSLAVRFSLDDYSKKNTDQIRSKYMLFNLNRFLDIQNAKYILFTYLILRI
jgi:hypothetical protein